VKAHLGVVQGREQIPKFLQYRVELVHVGKQSPRDRWRSRTCPEWHQIITCLISVAILAAVQDLSL
jgi:hypothetical protein